MISKSPDKYLNKKKDKTPLGRFSIPNFDPSFVTKPNVVKETVNAQPIKQPTEK